MNINTETLELLIDYILDENDTKILSEKYVGFENIVVTLCRKGEVTIPRNQDIEEFFDSLHFIVSENCAEGFMKYRTNEIRLTLDDGFDSYRRKVMTSTEKGIRQAQREIKELQQKLDKIRLFYKN